MKCPNCGVDMAEGSLYCEHCGEDIHIVPDFEPELEQNMQQTIHTILEDLQEHGGEGREADLRRHAKRKLLPRILIGAAILLVAAVCGGGWLVYGYFSEEYQIDRALRYAAGGKYDRAIACYTRALELDGDNIELIFSLAELQLLKNNKVEYEHLLRRIVKNENATSEQLDRAYGKLIAIYRDRGDYQTINDLLLACDNETLLSTYQNYIARVPEFSVNEGYYTSVQPLSLTAPGVGKIYYTLDGTQPTEQGTEYTAPIMLENGYYMVKAYFVNDWGVASEVVTREYHIDNAEVPPPEISIESGEYHSPMMIEVVGDVEDVYYTTDGTDPTYSSNMYTEPIPMPLGGSRFCFARIVDGVTGTVEEKEYWLVLDTDLTSAQAVEAVVEFALLTGKIHDEEGHFENSEAAYLYEYQYVANINEVDDFYVIAEVFRDIDGTLTKTGNNYAVNVYTGERFKLQQDGRRNLSLVEIEDQIDSEIGTGIGIEIGPQEGE